jgi:hypothetical protein
MIIWFFNFRFSIGAQSWFTLLGLLFMYAIGVGLFILAVY